MKTFFESVHCASKVHCHTCRDRVGGVKWREFMAKHFQMDGVDWECPYGESWLIRGGRNGFPGAVSVNEADAVRGEDVLSDVGNSLARREPMLSDLTRRMIHKEHTVSPEAKRVRKSGPHFETCKYRRDKWCIVSNTECSECPTLKKVVDILWAFEGNWQCEYRDGEPFRKQGCCGANSPHIKCKHFKRESSLNQCISCPERKIST